MGVVTKIKRNLKLIEELKKIDKSRVRVGFVGESPKERKLIEVDGIQSSSLSMTVGDIATIHEYGAPSVGIPERAPIRKTAVKKGKRIRKVQAKLLDDVLKQRTTLDKALNVLGVFIVGETKATIREGLEPALQPETIRRKGSSTPLVDTGQLINSVNYDVKMGKDEE